MSENTGDIENVSGAEDEAIDEQAEFLLVRETLKAQVNELDQRLKELRSRLGQIKEGDAGYTQAMTEYGLVDEALAEAQNELNELEAIKSGALTMPVIDAAERLESEISALQATRERWQEVLTGAESEEERGRATDILAQIEENIREKEAEQKQLNEGLEDLFEGKIGPEANA